MDRAKDVSPKVILSVSLYADLTRINYWARESERLRGTPATGSAQLHPTRADRYRVGLAPHCGIVQAEPSV